MNHIAFISIGTNLGILKDNIKQAYAHISSDPKIDIISSSKLYSSMSWGYESNQQFLNSVLKIETNYGPGELLEALQRMESVIGRQKLKDTIGYEDRLIDLDIIFYDALVISSPSLTIPHRFMHERNFVLKPLVEIGHNVVHPLYLTTVSELLIRCPDKVLVHESDTL